MDGNYLGEDIKGTYDVAWLSHILHGEGPEDCRMIVRQSGGSFGAGWIDHGP